MVAGWKGRLCGLLVVFFFVSLSAGQECATSCAMNFTACTNINYMLYVNDTVGVAKNESTARTYISAVAGIVDQTCLLTFSRFMCSVVHPACNMNNASLPPLQPCNQICYDLHQDCEPYLGLVPFSLKPLLNCSDPNFYSNSSSPECSYLSNTLPLCLNNSLELPGACQNFNVSLAPTYGEICSPFVSDTIYVPEDTPDAITKLDSTISPASSLIKLVLPITPINCAKNILSMLCPLIFPTCLMVDVPQYGTQVAVGQQVCDSFCENALDLCEPFFEVANLTYVLPVGDCAHFRYPTTNPYIVDVGGVLLNVSCRDTLFPENAYAQWEIPNVTCPAETGKKLHPSDDDAPCGLRCPDSSYSLGEWHTIIVLTQAGSSISFVCMVFLIASYLLIFEKRRFPTSLHLNEFAATLMFSVSFLIGGSHPDKDVWCVDEGTNATQSNNTTCGVQGFFFIFFGLALTAWCCVIAFIIFYTLVVNRAQNSLPILYRNVHYLYMFGWGIPLIFAIAAVASGSIGYGPPLAWCFVHFNGFGFGSGLSKDYPLFYIPDGVLFIVILILFWTTVGVIVHIRRNRLQVDNVGFDIFLRTQIRVLIFIFVIFAIFFTIYEWRLAVQAQTDEGNLDSVGLNWAYCKMKISLNIDNPGDCSGDKNPARVDYPHTVFESFLLSGIGFLIFVAFGSDHLIFRQWAKMIKLTVRGEWDDLGDLITKGKDPDKKIPETDGTRSTHRTKESKEGPSKNSKSSKSSKSSHSNSNESGKNEIEVKKAEDNNDDVEMKPTSSTARLTENEEAEVQHV